MVATTRAWYSGSYTMAAKPIKTLELHYTMIQFLIIRNSRLKKRGMVPLELHFETPFIKENSTEFILIEKKWQIRSFVSPKLK